MNNKFSIVTPSYNRKNFIEQTIVSVLEQSYQNLEFTVVDGASTDETLFILEKYTEDTRFSYISEKDDGMYDAINKGFCRATGDILAYINTDDRYFPWTLEVVDRFFSENDEVDFVYGDTLVQCIPENLYKLHLFVSVPVDWLRSCLLIAQPTVFFRRRCFEEVGLFRKDVQLLGDCEYWLRLLEKGFKARKIHEVLAIEMNHDSTLRSLYKSKIEEEKRFLFNTYSRGIYRKNSIRRLVRFTEALGRFALYSAFIAKSSGLLDFVPSWSNFLKAYTVEKSWSSYVRNKLKRGPVYWTINKHLIRRTHQRIPG
jgi:glycosyltransferase involved in cell wall biosynthesis